MSELKRGEAHPASYYAREWILNNYTIDELFIMLEAMSSCAIEGNKEASICADTLDRMLTSKPCSDRYIMGLAWYLHKMKAVENDKAE